MEKDRETLIGCLSYTPQPGNPGMCPDWEWNWRPFTLQNDALQSHSGQGYTYLLSKCLIQ